MPIDESIRANDRRFVAKVLRRYKLTPWPIYDWYTQYPTRWNDDGRALQVEHYEWGCVVFASNAAPQWDSTLVCRGKVDWERGICVDGDDIEPIPIPWIFAVDFGEVVQMPQSEAIPDCVGLHEHGSTCDGGLNPRTGEVEQPCPWRSRCYGLKLHLTEAGQTPHDFLDGFADPVAMHAALADIERQRLLRIPPPAIVQASGGLAKGTVSAKKRKRKRPRRRWARIYEPSDLAELRVYSDAFLERLRKLMQKQGYGWANSRAAALPGEIYPSQSQRWINYIVIYVAADTAYRKLAVIRFLTGAMCIDVSFRANWDDALGVPGTRLRTPNTQNVFGNCQWHPIRDVRTARIAAKRIALMARRGIIKIGPPRFAPQKSGAMTPGAR